MFITLTRDIAILVFFGLLSLGASAQSYSHDNTYCRLGERSIEIEVRSSEKYTLPDEAEYGEFIMIKNQDKTLKVALDPQKIGRYRLLKGESANCSKALSLPMNEEQLAIFFLKDNKPFKDKLLVLNFNFKTSEFSRFESPYMTDTARIQDGKLYFESAAEDCEKKSGHVVIQDKKHNFIEKELEPWISYDGRSFKLDESLTYMEFEWKHLFPDAKSFFQHMKRKKKFIIATNFEAKSTCISFEGAFLCNSANN